MDPGVSWQECENLKGEPCLLSWWLLLLRSMIFMRDLCKVALISSIWSSKRVPLGSTDTSRFILEKESTTAADFFSKSSSMNKSLLKLPAIYGRKRLVLSWAQIMNRSGRQFFAHSCFATNNDRTIKGGELFDATPEILHRYRFTDDFRLDS